MSAGDQSIDVMSTSTADSDNDDQTGDLSECLTSEYEILRRIFSYLPMEDLWSAEQVCREWKSVVDITRKDRIFLESFIVSEQKYKMSDIWTEASACISFCTTPRKETEIEVSKCLAPKGESVLCLATSGVIGTTHDLSQIVQQKVRVGLPLAPKRFYISSLRFPVVPNVGIQVFEWNESIDKDFSSLNARFSLPNDAIVKCLIILMVEDDGRHATIQKDNFVGFLQSRQKENFAVGGCVVDGILEESGCNSRFALNKYIVFYGDGLEAESTVLTSDIKSIPAIDSKVEKLKKVVKYSKNGFLFVFRCAGRHRVLRQYKPRNDITKWEADAILKHFSNTPVIGCFGYGEFGTEFPDELNSISPKKKFKGGAEIFEHSYSTSIVHIGFTK